MKKKRTTFRLAAFLFAVLMALSLFGCGQKKPEAQESISLAVVTETPTADPTEAARPTETPTAEPTESAKPTETPTAKPTETVKPTEKPTETPKPTQKPTEAPESTPSVPNETEEDLLDPDGTYTSKEDVALYLYQYGELPQNFITKKEARELGWSGGGLDDYAYGYCIGGDKYGNYEGNLPDGNYHECDIDTLHKKKRGAKRIVYSDDGRIYYTDDHYATFTLLYGEE